MNWDNIVSLKNFNTGKPKNKRRRAKSQSKSAGFYYSKPWYSVRYKALKRSNGCCECCGARGQKVSPLHVDHIKPRSKFPELSLTLANLQVLCEACNLGKSNIDMTDWRD